ncbi:MAG: leucine-rich repeat protein, partial [Clostridia bacterium]|nr:leucine-rich repeat protein [Clostridia bacterium]
LDSEGLLTISGNSYMQFSFENRRDIKKVIIKNGIIDISYRAFYGCSSLESVSIPNSIEKIWEEAFKDCVSLTSVTIPSGEIGGEAFAGCSNLKQVILGNGVTSLYGDDGIDYYGSFYGCHLEKVYIPKNLFHFNSINFCCASIGAIEVDPENPMYYSEGNCVIKKLDKTLVMGCKNSVIPKDVKAIGSYAFARQEDITSVVIPEGVTLIGEFSFGHCVNIKEITIPASVRKIEDELVLSMLETYDEEIRYYQTEDGDTIYVPTSKIISDTTIYAVPGSYAQKYAMEHGYTVKCLNEHAWDEGVVFSPATCAKDGAITYTCTICEETKTEAIPARDHTIVTDEAVAATCTTDGKTKGSHCSVCGAVLQAQTVVKAAGHQWDSGKVTKAATEKTEGVKTYTCSVCGEQKTEPIPPVAPVEPTNKPTVTVGAVTARAGEEIEVPVSIANNPGINTFSFGLDYDTARLQLKDVTIDPALGGQFTFKEKAVWLSAADTGYNGTILTLTFTVAADAQEGDIPVAVTYRPGDIANLKEEDVSFQLMAGKISVRAYQPGDINGDNKVNNKDLTRLMKYLAGDAVTVSADALDVNGDGKVNNKDLTRLMKYLAGDNVSIY